MKILLMIVVGICLGSCLTYAGTYTYGWEDGGTVLGFSGKNRDGSPVLYASNVSPRNFPVHTGQHSLRLEDNMQFDSPTAFLAAVYGLQPGDTVRAGFYRLDTGAPGCAIMGHWCDTLPKNLFSNSGDAGSQDDLLMKDWELVHFDFVVPLFPVHSGLVIEVCTYGDPGDILYIDDLVVDIPRHASILLPNASWVGSEEISFGSVKALFR